MEGDAEIERIAQEEERQFVIGLGGHALALAGGVLVVHERLPGLDLNFVQEIVVSRERQTALFERTLDYYFQRALRPVIRVRTPAAGWLEEVLRTLAFEPSDRPLQLLVGDLALRRPASVRALRVADDRPSLEQFLEGYPAETRTLEFLQCVEVAARHPNPGEELLPAHFDAGEAGVAAALVFDYRGAGGLHLLSPVAEKDPHLGAALTLAATSLLSTRAARSLAVRTTNPQLAAPLVEAGFRRVREDRLWKLPPGADLALPAPGSPQPPRWRPPRMSRQD